MTAQINFGTFFTFQVLPFIITRWFEQIDSVNVVGKGLPKTSISFPPLRIGVRTRSNQVESNQPCWYPIITGAISLSFVEQSRLARDIAKKKYQNLLADLHLTINRGPSSCHDQYSECTHNRQQTAGAMHRHATGRYQTIPNIQKSFLSFRTARCCFRVKLSAVNISFDFPPLLIWFW